MTEEITGCNTGNRHVKEWVEEAVRLCEPDGIHWCDGSAEEKERLTAQAVHDALVVLLGDDRCLSRAGQRQK